MSPAKRAGGILTASLGSEKLYISLEDDLEVCSSTRGKETTQLEHMRFHLQHTHKLPGRL